MYETHGCAPACETWGAIGVCVPWEVRTKLTSCDATVTCVLPVLCVFLRLFAQYSMNPYVTPRVLEGAPSDAVRAHADAVRALEQLTASLANLHGVNTGFVERHLDHTRLSTSPKSTEAHFRKLKTGYTAPYGPNNHRKIVQTRSAVLRPVWSRFSQCA